jgi:hypothetical protein
MSFKLKFGSNENSYNQNFGSYNVVYGGEGGATFYPQVSASGVISWTNDRNLPNPPAVNIKGQKGDKGEKGDTGATGSRCEKGDTGAQGIQGMQGIQGIQGVKGDTGEPFTISKVYSSIASMNSSYNTDGVKIGHFVVIATGNVDDEDNAKLFLKGNTRYEYITDLSGAQGMRGEKGEQGEQGVQGEQGEQGKDYVLTYEDKKEIAHLVIEELPVAEDIAV